MNQNERLDYLVTELCKDSDEYKALRVEKNDRRRILRSLMNIRMPKPISNDFLNIQDAFLQEELNEKGIVDIKNIPTIAEKYKSNLPFADRICIWLGDITCLAADAIVNAANSQMLGCFYPCHGCIDNAIHSAAGIQLRVECSEIMKMQGHEEETGNAKITLGYNLPCKHVIHTVGPIVQGALTKDNKVQLTSCYKSCLELAEKNHLRNITFCCISTGEFHFPNDKAAKIAIGTVLRYLEHSCLERVVFNVFKETDKKIYERECKIKCVS